MAGHQRPLLPGGATSAISLTFDGGLAEHVELVAPILREAGLRATFFVTVPALLSRPQGWRDIVGAGHELGNHAHFEVSERGELARWSRSSVREDVLETSRGIGFVTEYLPTSFALSGESTLCADGDYLPELVRIFSAIRSAEVGSNDLATTNPKDVRCIPWQRVRGSVVQMLPRPGEWTVPVFSEFFSLPYDAAEDDLRLLVQTLAIRPEIWTAPFGEVAAQLPLIRESR